MEDIYNDKESLKKSVTNSITYNINKKMNSYNETLNNIYKKVETNNKLNNIILEILAKNNEDLSKKINNLENIIYKLIDNFNETKYFKDNNCYKYENIKSNENENEKIDENVKSDGNKSSIRELKIEDFNIDKTFIKKCIDMTNINGDILLFKIMYIDNVGKEYYPIRHIKKKLQYWNNNCMNDDDNGTYIKNTIIKNIEQCYFKINVYENYKNNVDQLIKNQEYLNQLNEQKYGEKLLNKIISIISI